MARILFVLLLLIFSLATEAQTIHWIVFGDTRDELIAEEVGNSISVYNSQFVDRINDAIVPKGYLPRQQTYTGMNFTTAKCNQVIKRLSCGKDDIIVFYYLGHAGRAEVGKDEAAMYNAKYPWPDLQFEDGSTRDLNRISLNDIHNSLKRKGARLTITMGMCCNNPKSQYKRHGKSSQSVRYKIVSKKFAKKVAQSLFLKHKGSLMVASAKPGEESQGANSYNGLDVDCFTSAICETMDKFANNDTGDNVTWAGFMNEVSSKCTALAKIQGEEQHPKVQNFTTSAK